MTLYTNSAEGGTNGTTVSTGNSGGASGTAWSTVSVGTGGAIVYSNSSPIGGTLSYLNTPASGQANYRIWTLGTTATSVFAFRYRLRLTGYPSTATNWIDLGHGTTGTAIKINLDTAGVLKVLTGSANTFRGDVSAAMSLNTIYRIEITGTLSATVGAVTVNVYVDSTGSLLGTYSISGVNTNTQINRVIPGKFTATGTMAAYTDDDFAFNDASNTEIGPDPVNASVTVPAIAATASTPVPTRSAAALVALPIVAGVTTAAVVPTRSAGATITPPAASVTAATPVPTRSAAAAVTAVALAVTVTAFPGVFSVPVSVTVPAPFGCTVVVREPSAYAENTVSGGGPIDTTVGLLPPTVLGQENVDVGVPAISAIVAGTAPSATGDAEVAMVAVAFTVTGVPPTLISNASITIPAFTCTLAAVAPTRTAESALTIPVAAVTINALPTAVSAGGNVQVGVPAMSATVEGLAPSLVADAAITAAVAAVTAEAVAPVVDASAEVAVPTASVDVAGLPPEVDTGTSVEVVAVAIDTAVAVLPAGAVVTRPPTPAGRTLSVPYENRTQRVPSDGGRAMPRDIFHDPSADLDYRWDWDVPDKDGNTWLGADVITDATVTCSDLSVTVHSQSTDGVSAVAFVSGGTVGRTAKLVCRIDTEYGRQDERTIYLRVRER